MRKSAIKSLKAEVPDLDYLAYVPEDPKPEPPPPIDDDTEVANPVPMAAVRKPALPWWLS